MKSFKHYLAESVRENYYVVKFVMLPTDQQLAVIESHLQKHDLIQMSKPEATLDDKVDFYDVPKKEIWRITFTTGMPVSTYVLMQEIKAALDIPEDYIIVRGSNEPVQLNSDDEEFNFTTKAMAKDDDLSPAARLSTDRFYNAEEEPLLTDVFGNDYNRRLLDYLAHVAEERPSEQYEPAAPLFSWIEMNKVMDAQAVDSEDFNKQFDTPKPVSGKGVNKPPVEPINLGPEGNFDDMVTPNVKLMKTKTGKRENLLAPRAGLKAEKVR